MNAGAPAQSALQIAGEEAESADARCRHHSAHAGKAQPQETSWQAPGSLGASPEPTSLNTSEGTPQGAPMDCQFAGAGGTCPFLTCAHCHRGAERVVENMDEEWS